MKTALVLLVSHVVVGVIGFGAGVYVLPILIAPPAPSAAEVRAEAGDALYSGEFRRDLEGSDALHWGEGTVHVGPRAISLEGAVAPGPDYKLYLSPELVETEADFLRLRSRMVRVGDVRTFRNFIVPIPEPIDPSEFRAVIVWCESFSEFITAAGYR